jgi:hypothetical protein
MNINQINNNVPSSHAVTSIVSTTKKTFLDKFGIPEDIIKIIFNILDPQDRLKLTQVDKATRAYILNNPVQRQQLLAYKLMKRCRLDLAPLKEKVELIEYYHKKSRKNNKLSRIEDNLKNLNILANFDKLKIKNEEAGTDFNNPNIKKIEETSTEFDKLFNELLKLDNKKAIEMAEFGSNSNN